MRDSLDGNSRTATSSDVLQLPTIVNLLSKMDIQITDRAIERLKATALKEGVLLDENYLRIGVVSGGCSGLTYDLGWDTTIQEKDRVSDVGGIRVLMDLNSFLYLAGTTLDFTDGLEGKGFHFHNPQAVRTCACGESFSL